MVQALSILPGQARAADVQIDWELRYPFRLFSPFSDSVANEFKDSSRPAWSDSWAGRRDLYVHRDCMTNRWPIRCSEEKLGPSRVATMRNALKTSAKPEDNDELARIFLIEGMKYDWKRRVHHLGKDDDALVLAPKPPGEAPRHKVWLRLKSEKYRNDITGWKCRWTVDGSDPVEGDCAGTKHTLKRTEDAGSTSNVSVTIVARPDIAAAAVSGKDTLVDEVLIVGIGDSFASGEGNPDIPARMSTTNFDSDGWPRRQAVGAAHAAQWVDRGCHRSLNGAQARAAIQLAAKQPRREIVFLGVACSGAETYEGVLGAYGGTDELSREIAEVMRDSSLSPLQRERWRHEMSQINQVLWALCLDPVLDTGLSNDAAYKSTFIDNYSSGAENARITCKKLKRTPDAVLLSIGGNDVGFSRVIFGLLTKNWVEGIIHLSPAGAACLVQGPTSSHCLTGESGWRTYSNSKCFRAQNSTRCKREARQLLARKYEVLAKVLKQTLTIRPDRVIAIQYPDPTKSSEGTCGAGGYYEDGLERWFGKTKVKRAELGPDSMHFDAEPAIARSDLSEVSDKLIKSLNDTISSAAGKAGWRVARRGLGEFRLHGLCTRLSSGSRPPEDYPSLSGFSREAGSTPVFNAYARTQRWFRNVNDAYMSQNTRPTLTSGSEGGSFIKKALKTRLMESYGAFHPNGLGSAALADAYYSELEELIAAQQP